MIDLHLISPSRSLEVGRELPCYVQDKDRDTALQCLISDEASQPDCAAKHPSTSRLCACVGEKCDVGHGRDERSNDSCSSGMHFSLPEPKTRKEALSMEASTLTDTVISLYYI